MGSKSAKPAADNESPAPAAADPTPEHPPLHHVTLGLHGSGRSTLLQHISQFLFLEARRGVRHPFVGQLLQSVTGRECLQPQSAIAATASDDPSARFNELTIAQALDACGNGRESRSLYDTRHKLHIIQSHIQECTLMLSQAVLRSADWEKSEKTDSTASAVASSTAADGAANAASVPPAAETPADSTTAVPAVAGDTKLDATILGSISLCTDHWTRPITESTDSRGFYTPTDPRYHHSSFPTRWCLPRSVRFGTTADTFVDIPPVVDHCGELQYQHTGMADSDLALSMLLTEYDNWSQWRLTLKDKTGREPPMHKQPDVSHCAPNAVLRVILSKLFSGSSGGIPALPNELLPLIADYTTGTLAHVAYNLWQLPAYQRAYRFHSNKHERLSERAYFMDRAMKWFGHHTTQPGVEPRQFLSVGDWLRTPARMSGAHECTYSAYGVSVETRDNGGVRHLRKQWQHLLSNNDKGFAALWYVVALSEYDQIAYEDEFSIGVPTPTPAGAPGLRSDQFPSSERHQSNRLQESLDIWRQLQGRRDVAGAPVFLVFTHYDLFVKKIAEKRVPLNVCFAEYQSTAGTAKSATGSGGVQTEIDSALAFIANKFAESRNADYAPLHTVYVNPLDARSVISFVRYFIDSTKSLHTQPVKF